METALKNIESYINNNIGESIDAWEEKIRDTELNISDYKTQIDDLLKLFNGFVQDTTAIISPISRHVMMRVDRDDIKANLEQIQSGFESNINKALRITYRKPYNNIFKDPTDDEIRRSNYNKAQIETIRSMIQRTQSRLNAKMNALWDIYHNKIVPFEDMDDHYSSLAKEVKDQYTDFFEFSWDFFSGITGFGWDFLRGAFEALYGIVEGIFIIVVDTGIVVASGIIPDTVEPDILKQAARERIDNYEQMIHAFLEDPMIIVESIAQGISDAMEEEGIAYIAGAITVEMAPGVAVAKFAKVGRVGKLIGKKTDVNQLDSQPRIISKELFDDIEKDLIERNERHKEKRRQREIELEQVKPEITPNPVQEIILDRARKIDEMIAYLALRLRLMPDYKVSTPNGPVGDINLSPTIMNFSVEKVVNKVFDIYEKKVADKNNPFKPEPKPNGKIGPTYIEEVLSLLKKLKEDRIPDNIEWKRFKELYMGKGRKKPDEEVVAYVYYEIFKRIDEDKVLHRNLLNSIDYERILKETGYPKPPGTGRETHAHHILYKIGLGKEQKLLVKEGRKLLLKYGIDPVVDPENLVWAWKFSHNIENLKEVLVTLKNAEIEGLKIAQDWDFIDNINIIKNVPFVEDVKVREIVKEELISALNRLGKKAEKR